MDFLNDVFQRPPGQEIIDLTLEDRELDPECAMERGARIDIVARASSGSLINVEVQVANQLNIDRRTLFYWARLYHGQLDQGQEYGKLRQTIIVNIIGFDWFIDDERYYHRFHVADDETGKIFCDQLEIHFMELEKARKINRQPATAIEEWLVYLNNMEEEEMDAIAERNPGIRKALTIEEMFWKDKEERRRYEMRQKYLRDEVSMLAGAEAKGEARGRTEGQVQATQKHIVQILTARFGPESSDLQTKVGQLRDPAVADQVFAELLTANSLEDADGLIRNALAQSHRGSSEG
jgi:predicted transposase/invertase (TIGR01784 family)